MSLSPYHVAQTLARFFRPRNDGLSGADVPDPRQWRGRRWSLPQRLQTVWAGVLLGHGSRRALAAALARQDPALARRVTTKRIPAAPLPGVLPGVSPEGVRPGLWPSHKGRVFEKMT
jgi:hypothetical protein